MTEFFFNFKDLTNIQNPNKAMLNLSSFLITDDYVKKLFPKRYNFYMKFVDGFSSPSNLYKYLYRTKESKDYYEELQGKLAKISNSLLKLSDKNKKKVLSILHSKLRDKDKFNDFFNVLENVIQPDKRNIKGGEEGEVKKIEEVPTTEAPKEGEEKKIEEVPKEEDNGFKLPPEPEIVKNIEIQPQKGTSNDININTDEEYLKDYYVKKPFKPMETFLNDVKKIAPVINLEPPKNINDLVRRFDSNKDKSDFFNVNTADISEKTDDLQQLYKNYTKNPLYSPERLEVNIYDRITFIIVTYIIRFLTLQFIYWCLNSNIINSFTKAFNYYTLIYILFFIFMTSIVNVMYLFPIFELFSNISAITVFPNYFYYFYVYTNGYLSLAIHIFIILILLFIPYVLVIDRKDADFNRITDNISYDYKKKNEIYISISNFSLIIWVLTSIISLKF
jgi:hypothetical protein